MRDNFEWTMLLEGEHQIYDRLCERSNGYGKQEVDQIFEALVRARKLYMDKITKEE